MLRAGTAAAAYILREFPDRLARGVALLAGSGNNGGDAYVIAAQLARAGVAVRVHAATPPRSGDAVRARALAETALISGAPSGDEALVVDGLLGTGHVGALREHVAAACRLLQFARDRGAAIIALDVPTGLDASSGEIAEGSVSADVTLCFGTLKRGLLVQRAHAGRIAVLDIGLRQHVRLGDRAWTLADDQTVARTLPPIAWNAHKGTRGGLALVGGAHGMAGAMVLATRGALASGAGLAKVWVEGDGVSVMQHNVPQAIALDWSDDESNERGWGDALAVGPGLGRTARSNAMLRRTLARYEARSIVLDADALTLAAEDTPGRADAGAADVIAAWCHVARDVVCTPHPGEFARLLGRAVPESLDERSAALSQFAVRARATVLLKGTPTLVCTPDGAAPMVVARGTALLATGGSGDLLTGIIGALLAAGVPPGDAAMLGATVHGLAAEIATARAGGVRGATLESVLDAMPYAWRAMHAPATFHQDILCELPAPVH